MTRNRPVIPGLPEDIALLLAHGGEGVPVALLSEEERRRLDSFLHPERRRSFALGRMAARRLLAERLGVAPAEAPLVVEPGGAPGVDGSPLFLSIAHAGRGAGALAGAVVADRPVGLDLERAVPRHPALLARLLAPEEDALLAALDVDEAAAAALVWALKEAVLKGLGTGFRRSARSIRLTPAGLAAVHADDGGPGWEVRYAREGPFWLAIAWRP